MRIIALATCFLALSVCTAAESLTSGVPVGKRPGPYSFLVATGKERGQSTCFICEQGKKPAVVIFARSLSDPLGKLLLKFDDETGTRKDFKAWMTLLTPKADLDALANWSKTQGLKSVPIGAFEDTDGPPAYLLHKDADVTVMVFANEKVLLNRSFRSGELTLKDVDAMMAEAKTALDKKKE